MALSVVDLLDKHDISYRKMGDSRAITRCLNPEHEDKNPSMSINLVTGLARCFSCGHKVNLFVEFNEDYNYDNVNMRKLEQQLIRIRASTVGLELPAGYTPYRRDFRGISADTLMKYEAFKVNTEEYQNRIIFPIRDITGKIRSLVGRHLYSDEKDKYKVWPSKTIPPMFPSKVSPIQSSVILVEGIFDALNMLEHGMKNTITFFGVTFNKPWLHDQLRLLRLQGVTKIYIMFDGDKAGQTGAKALITVLDEAGFQHDIVELPEDTDPGDLTAEDISALGKLIYGKEGSYSRSVSE